MFDDFADHFNWPGHMGATFDVLFHGPFAGRCFFVSLESGWTGTECEELLAKSGIEINARDIIEGHALFWVANADAERAYDILTRAGCPVGILEEAQHEPEYLF